MFDFQDEPQSAGGLPHGAIARVGGVIAGADTIAWATFRTGVLAHRTASPSCPLVPQTFPPLSAVDVFTGPGIYAFPLVGHSDGPSHDARGPSEVAGAGIHFPVIATQVLLR